MVVPARPARMSAASVSAPVPVAGARPPRAASGACRPRWSTPGARPALALRPRRSWSQYELVIGGQRGQGRGGLPDMPPLDHGVRLFVPLEQGVSAEGHYDAHAWPGSVAIMRALIVCIRFSAWSNTTEAGDSKTSSVTSSASSPRLA